MGFAVGAACGQSDSVLVDLLEVCFRIALLFVVVDLLWWAYWLYVG